MVDVKVLNELYNCLDLYIVTSRVEGGPQSIVECATNKTPIISTDVGIASEILSENSIFNMNNFEKAIPDIETAFKNSSPLRIPQGFEKFNEMFNLMHFLKSDFKNNLKKLNLNFILKKLKLKKSFNQKQY